MGYALPEDIIHNDDLHGLGFGIDETAKEVDKALYREAERVAKTFPSLQNAPGVSPWDPVALAEWANGPKASKAAYQSVSFLLDYYMRFQIGHERYKMAEFDVFEAMREWSDEDRDAFRSVWSGDYPTVDEYDPDTGRLIKGKSFVRKWREESKEMRNEVREALGKKK